MKILTTGAFRLFFPVAGLFAALAVTLWLWNWSASGAGWLQDGLRWHRHEMLFGYLGLALGGFLLTAVPNWTGRATLTGARLSAIFGLWLIGRAGFAALPPGGLASLCVLAYPLVLAAYISREIWAGGNRRNLPIAAMVWLFTIANGLFLTGAEETAQRMGFALALVMIALVGGRITPAFSRNWLRAQGSPVEISGFDLVDKLALGVTVLAALCWVVLPDHPLGPVLSVLAATALTWRLIRWRADAVAREPLLLALHLGYAWVPISFALLAAAQVGLAAPVQALHGIGAGAVGGMTMIVMMRAILGHANRPLQGTAADLAQLALVHLGAMLRVLAPLAADPMLLIQLSGGLWGLGFAVFFLRYGRLALAPRL